LGVTTSFELYVPTVCVTVKLSLPTCGVSEKFADVNVAVVFPLYGRVGSPMIDAVSVSGLMCPGPLAVVGKL
jgi:hypothetical protein